MDVDFENEYLKDVKSRLLRLYNTFDENITDPFPTCIQRCLELFGKLTGVADGIHSYSLKLVEKEMNPAEALQLIKEQVIPWLQIAKGHFARYTSSPENLQQIKKQFEDLQSHVQSWFESPSPTSDVPFHEPRREIGQEPREVALQRKVKELENAIKTWENRYSNLEQDRETIMIGFRMVKNEKDELSKQKKALEAVNRNLLNTQTDKNAEISTLRGTIGTLNREVDRLKAEVVRLNTPWWQKYGTNSDNMQTLLADLNNLRE